MRSVQDVCFWGNYSAVNSRLPAWRYESGMAQELPGQVREVRRPPGAGQVKSSWLTAFPLDRKGRAIMLSFSPMDAKVLDKLYKLGAVERLPTGEDGVRVSLQYQSKFTEPSRSHRRNALQTTFENISKAIHSEGAQIDMKSLSVSGQTVEAVLPIDKYDNIAAKLNEQDVRVDLLTDKQVI